MSWRVRRRLYVRVAVEVEVEIEHLTSPNLTAARELEAELLEQRDGGSALDAHIEDDLEVGVVPAEGQGLLYELGADAVAAMALAHAESANLGGVLRGLLDPDHSDDVVVVPCDPEVALSVV